MQDNIRSPTGLKKSLEDEGNDNIDEPSDYFNTYESPISYLISQEKIDDFNNQSDQNQNFDDATEKSDQNQNFDDATEQSDSNQNFDGLIDAALSGNFQAVEQSLVPAAKFARKVIREKVQVNYDDHSSIIDLQGLIGDLKTLNPSDKYIQEIKEQQISKEKETIRDYLLANAQKIIWPKPNINSFKPFFHEKKLMISGFKPYFKELAPSHFELFETFGKPTNVIFQKDVYTFIFADNEIVSFDSWWNLPLKKYLDESAIQVTKENPQKSTKKIQSNSTNNNLDQTDSKTASTSDYKKDLTTKPKSYAEQRLENIRKNNEFLQSLNIPSISMNHRPETTIKALEKRKKTKKIQDEEDEDYVNSEDESESEDQDSQEDQDSKDNEDSQDFKPLKNKKSIQVAKTKKRLSSPKKEKQQKNIKKESEIIIDEETKKILEIFNANKSPKPTLSFYHLTKDLMVSSEKECDKNTLPSILKQAQELKIKLTKEDGTKKTKRELCAEIVTVKK